MVCMTEPRKSMVHPHNLVGRKECFNGISEVRVPPGASIVSFANLGVQCATRREVQESICIRESIGVDPFQQGFEHGNEPKTIDLKRIRLCFEVFLGEVKTDNNRLAPVVSDLVYAIRPRWELKIVKMSEHECGMDGGNRDIIMLCEKIKKDDIGIRFYEERDDGKVVWEGFGIFQPGQVHKQAALWFRPPEYGNLDVEVPVNVNVQLVRPSDGAVSKPVAFRYIPDQCRSTTTDSVDLQRPAKKKATDFNNLTPTPPAAAAAYVDPWKTPQGLNIPLTMNVAPKDNSVSLFGGQVTLEQSQEESSDAYVDNLVNQLLNDHNIQPQNWNEQPVLVPSDSNIQRFAVQGQTTTTSNNNLADLEDYHLEQIITPGELNEIVLDSGDLDEQMLSASLSNVVL